MHRRCGLIGGAASPCSCGLCGGPHCLLSAVVCFFFDSSTPFALGKEKIPWTSDTQPELCRAGIPHEYLEFMLLLQQHTTLEFKLHRADCLTTQRACNECAIWATFPENSQGFLTCLCRVHTCILLCTGYRRTEHRKIKCEWTPLKKETRNLNKPPCAVL